MGTQRYRQCLMYMDNILCLMKTQENGVKIWIPIGYMFFFFVALFFLDRQGNRVSTMMMWASGYIHSFIFFGLVSYFLPLLCEALKCRFKSQDQQLCDLR